MPPETLSTSEGAENLPSVEHTCVTCGHLANEEYCPHCGEKQHRERNFSMRHVLAEAAEAFFHVDSKIFLSLRTLVRRPGKLTAEFFLGRRKPYMSPLQLFFVCNLIFFVLQPFTGLEILGPPLGAFDGNGYLHRIAQSHVDATLARRHISSADQAKMEDFKRRFASLSHLQAKSLVLLMAPMLAIVLAVLYLGTRRLFSEHLIFALHAYAWWLLWLLVILGVMAVFFVITRVSGHAVSSELFDEIATLLEFGGFGVYLGLAMKRFYRKGAIVTVLRAIPVTVALYGIFHVYRLVLLFTILYAM
jgi:hypothetical protein